MGRLFLMSLAPTGTIYSCKHCDTPLAYAHQILSRLFRCKHGKAYLFDKVVNVNAGEKDDRMMTTGLHTVCDIFCVTCGSILGWKYVSAFEKEQRYKEGKFILERFKINSGSPTGRVQLWAEHDGRRSSSEDDDQGAA
ncbi:protein yippee-like [Lolium rigidum]|uniref:protein yippee-like n=1 Tax=Lolium rigidum TaxID=89674 RepID=UPI001F5D1F49|nr:protein yippee-like [Lolium rigidum]